MVKYRSKVIVMLKNLKYAELLDHYSTMLTDRQREMLTYYYNEDLSLSEISELAGASRQGVMDLLRRAEAQLDLMESKLHLSVYARSLGDCAQRLHKICEQLPDNDLKNDLKAVINDLSKLPL